jgi:phosphoribosylformylglycinamidine synthase
VEGDAPILDLNAEKALQNFLLEAAGKKLLRSAHDVSDGGLAVALAEAAIGHNENNSLGAEISLQSGLRPDFLLFGEDQTRVVVSIAPEKKEDFLALTAERNIPVQEIGTVVPDLFRIRLNGKLLLDTQTDELKTTYTTAIDKHMQV